MFEQEQETYPNPIRAMEFRRNAEETVLKTKAAPSLEDLPTLSPRDTILLVDDEPYVLSSLTRALRNTPYHVFTAANGSQALEII